MTISARWEFNHGSNALAQLKSAVEAADSEPGMSIILVAVLEHPERLPGLGMGVWMHHPNEEWDESDMKALVFFDGVDLNLSDDR